MKKSGVRMVVRLCVEMHSQKIVGLVHLSNEGKYKLLCTSDYFAVASRDFITANIKNKKNKKKVYSVITKQSRSSTL